MSALRLTTNGVPSRYPKIVVSATHSTLPYRELDYCAYRDGEEELGGYGYGSSREAAIRDFFDNRDEDEPFAILAHPTFRQWLIIVAIVTFAVCGMLGVEALNAAEAAYQAGLV